MSIHKSKGLEFPVVVVAGLGGQFNLQDLREDILLDEIYGLCPKVAPPETGQRYPSLPYWLARRRQKQEALGEELRLLYVALTRARDTLILAGTTNRSGTNGKWESTGPAPLTDQEVLSAKSCLDWLRLWLPQVTSESDWASETEGETDWLRWRIYAENDARLRATARAAVPPARPPESAARDAQQSDRDGRAPQREGSAGVPPAAVGVPPTESARALDELRQRIAWRYGHDAATRERAKRSVSELRRQMVEEDEEAEAMFSFQPRGSRIKARTEGTPKAGELSDEQSGTAQDGRAASSSPSSPREERAGRGPRRGETNKNAPPLPSPLLHPMEEREKSRSLMQPCQDGDSWNSPACQSAGRPLRGELTAADRGTAHHKFLQHAALDRLDSLAGLQKEVERLTRAGKLAQNEAAALNLPALAAFWNSDLGKKIRTVEASRVCRELAFTVRLSAEDLARLNLADAAALKDEFIVAQGRIDVAVILSKEIWLLDFKTDQLTEAELEAKCAAYAPQLQLYALALSGIYKPRPVTER